MFQQERVYLVSDGAKIVSARLQVLEGKTWKDVRELEMVEDGGKVYVKYSERIRVEIPQEKR